MKRGQGSRGKGQGARKKILLFFSLFTLNTSLLTVVWASDLTVKTKVDKDTITVGDPVKYTIFIDMNRGFIPRSIKLPDAKANLYPFEVLDYKLNKRGEGEIVLEWTISAYRIGEYDIPPVEIAYTDESGVEKRAAAEIHTIKVKSILPEGAKDLMDIKGPLSLHKLQGQGAGVKGQVLFLSLIFLSFFGILLFLLRRKRRRVSEIQRLPTPVEIALGELEEIMALSLFEKGEIKRYYALIADVVRRFIAAQYNVDAARRTTGEVVEGLRGIQSLNGRVEQFASFLYDCDIVKFSRYNPTAEDAREIMERAEEIVKGSRVKA